MGPLSRPNHRQLSCHLARRFSGRRVDPVYHSAWRQNRRPYLGMDSITRWWRPLRVGQDRRRLARRQPIATAAPSAPFELRVEPQEQVSVNDPTAFFTLWVALFTGVLGVSTILLWRATNRSVKISERALHDLER